MKQLTFPGNVSYSSFNLFRECERRFFYSKILKLTPEKTDMKYANLGKCVHKAIETSTKPGQHWKEHDLHNTEFKIEDAEKQVNYAQSLGYKFKSKEEEIKFTLGDLNFKLVIDFTTDDGSIGDWKTSTFNVKKVTEYKDQLLWYCWGIWKSKGYIPPKAYLVFTKARKVFEWSFTEEELLQFERHISETIGRLNQKVKFDDYTLNVNSCHFCEFKTRCQIDSLQKNKYLFVEFIIDHDNITVVSDIVDPMFYEVIEDIFSYEMDNAHFVKKAMLAKGVKNFDTKVKLFRDNKYPIGFYHKLREIMFQYAEYRDKTLVIGEKDVRVFNDNKINVPGKLIDVELRDYQVSAVEHILKDKISMTEICTGAGKTTIAAEIIRRIGQQTLFVVDRNILLTQTKKAFDSMLGINCGTITEGSSINGDGVDIATIQTISNYLKNEPEFKEFLTKYNVIIVDEAHGAKSKSYKELMKHISAEYRIALTGTAYADGNASLELYRSFGFPDYKIRAIDLIDKGYLVKPEITFLDYDEGFITHGDFNEVYEQVLRSEGRCELLHYVVNEQHAKKNNILIMVDRIEHVDLIQDHIGKCNVITGSTNGKVRENILKSLKDNKGNILIATSAIIQKGVDIPTLDVIINYSANLGTIKTVQSLGRVLRKSEGKEKAWYYDFNDLHKVLKPHTKARKDALIEQGYEIK